VDPHVIGVSPERLTVLVVGIEERQQATNRQPVLTFRDVGEIELADKPIGAKLVMGHWKSVGRSGKPPNLLQPLVTGASAVMISTDGRAMPNRCSRCSPKPSSVT